MNKKLVVLGGGVGGLSVINEIRQSGLAFDDLDTTLVDEDFSHFLGFTLPWVMRGWRNEVSVPIRPSGDALAGVNDVAMSPDGAGVYTAAYGYSGHDEDTGSPDTYSSEIGAVVAAHVGPGLVSIVLHRH